MEQKINKVNYKSDFDFTANFKAFGNGGKVEIGFANYDWEITLTTGCNEYATKGYVVSYKGGVCTNCFNDGGKVHIVMNDHKLNVGQLQGTIKANIPNAIYPDGHQLLMHNVVLPFELVTDNGDEPTEVEVEILLPYLYDSAYRIAVASGYKGTQEEYFALASQLPNAVETANKVSESADSLANSAEKINGAIETLASTTDAIEQGANVIKDNADTLQESANIVKTSAEQIGDNIKELQESINAIGAVHGGLESATITLTQGAIKVETSATTLEGVSATINSSATSLAESATAIAEGANTIKSSADTLQENADKVSESATKVEQAVEPLAQASESLDATKQAFEMLSSEWISGRTKIADALTRKHSPTEASESFDAMAQKVMDLPLAVEGQEGIIDQTANGIINGYDLLNELHKYQRQDYPYCCGVEFTPQRYKSVILSGAEAYRCSDGFFTTEQEVEHTFAEDYKLSHYIIYYFSYPTYQIPTQINYALRIVAYNGQPRFVMSNIWCPLVQSFTNERYSVGTAELDINRGGCISSVMLCGISEYAGTISGGQNNAMMTSVALPHLEVLNGGYISQNSNNLKSISIPNLRVIDGGTIINSTGVEYLSLPSLEVVNGGTELSRGSELKEINVPNLREWRGGWLNYGASKLEKLSFPNLEFCQSTSGFLQYIPPVLHFPKLKFARNLIAQAQRVGGAGTIDIYLPAIEGDFTHSSITGANVYVAVHLGNQQGKNISMNGDTRTRVSSITVEDGFRSGLNISNYSHLEASVVEDIIDHLADNNDYEPLTLTLGTTLKGKISAEYIAIATAKNYNIA